MSNIPYSHSSENTSQSTFTPIPAFETVQQKETFLRIITKIYTLIYNLYRHVVKNETVPVSLSPASLKAAAALKEQSNQAYYVTYALQLMASRYLINGMEIHEQAADSMQRIKIQNFFISEFKRLQLPETHQTMTYINVLETESIRVEANLQRSRNRHPMMAMLSNMYGERAELNPNQKEIDAMYNKSLSKISEAVRHAKALQAHVESKKELFAPLIRREHLCGDANVTNQFLEPGETLVVILGKKFKLPYRVMPLNELRATLYYFRFLISQQVNGEFNPQSLRDLEMCHKLDKFCVNYYLSKGLKCNLDEKFEEAEKLYYTAAVNCEKGDKIRANLLYEAAGNYLYGADLPMGVLPTRQFHKAYEKVYRMDHLAKRYFDEAMNYYRSAKPAGPAPYIESEAQEGISDFLQACKTVFGFVPDDDDEGEEKKYKFKREAVPVKENAREKSVESSGSAGLNSSSQSQGGSKEEEKAPAISTTDRQCIVCGKSGKETKLKRCARCKDSTMLFCGKGCQAGYWKSTHRYECKPVEGGS